MNIPCFTFSGSALNFYSAKRFALYKSHQLLFYLLFIYLLTYLFVFIIPVIYIYPDFLYKTVNIYVFLVSSVCYFPWNSGHCLKDTIFRGIQAGV